MNIQQTVKEEIFPMLGEGKIDEAEKKLRRLMLTLTDKNTTEDHRIVLCNIGRIRYLSGDIENAKYYMGRFKEILEKDDKYIEEYRDRYIDYMNLYSEVYEDDLSIDEQIEINNINLENAIINNDTARIYTAKANIAFLTKDIEEVENVLMDIHNYEKSKLIDENKLISAEILKNLCNLKIEIYKEIKRNFPDYSQEDYNCAY
ncbi:hypothetical protein [Paraclostridium bifermentans]|uniref:hypothetical protein n=1 Tax=Paraclostridium bifermentans TaxID=1490 RepID=UPI00189C8155|nr:hypothetical protein [Paraclostridium bifermentans]